MVAPATDRLMDVKETCDFLAVRLGERHRPHIATLYRWMQKGRLGIRLSFIQVGGKRFVSVEGLEAYFSALTAKSIQTRVVAPKNGSSDLCVSARVRGTL